MARSVNPAAQREVIPRVKRSLYSWPAPVPSGRLLTWEAGIVRAVAIIPARYGSTRFPGKALAPILGRPMIQWVYERASKVRGVERLLVATDDERIAGAVLGFGGEVVMTSRDCPSGSDRVWEAVSGIPCDVVVNLQGDEPALQPSSVEALLELMEDPAVGLGTLVTPIGERAEYEDPNVVKAVMSEGERCLYFSRSPVPYLRTCAFEEAVLWRHVGIYAFRRDVLESFVSWPVGRLEALEGLEQLRALEHGVGVRAAVVEWSGCAVDVPADVALAEAYLRKEEI